MRLIKNIFTLSWILILSCTISADEKKQEEDTQKISDPVDQKSTFDKLVQITQHKIPPKIISDSLFFLIVPIDAACNNCRDKATIATVQHRGSLKQNHFVIFSANGLKPIKLYFQEQNVVLPDSNNNNIFIDKDNLAFINDLIFTHPTVYHCYEGKAYEKIAGFPLNIKEVLEKFFN